MGFSTKVGYLNPNDQEVLGPTSLAGTDRGQSVYVLKCGRCAAIYGANGSDIAQRRCPECEGGRTGFSVSASDIVEPETAAKSKRNPNWTRDELILALDLYFECPTLDQHQRQVIELSELLNHMWNSTGNEGSETLRNPSSVSMKLSNFQRLDPAYLGRGRKGLAHGAAGDQEIWQEFSADRERLLATAVAIRFAIEKMPNILAISDLSEDEDAAEGAILSRVHRYRERNGKLAKKRKAQTLSKFGLLVCEACEFDFARGYGERGAGYIEVHHTKPLETLERGARTKLSDLAILCANCHRMVHAKRPWLSMDELVDLVQRRRAALS